jgi:broad specificity phosphatase PhoE
MRILLDQASRAAVQLTPRQRQTAKRLCERACMTMRHGIGTITPTGLAVLLEELRPKLENHFPENLAKWRASKAAALPPERGTP